MSTLFIGQNVSVTAPHNHFNACPDTMYQIGAINRVCGQYVALLLKDGKPVGAVPEVKLSLGRN